MTECWTAVVGVPAKEWATDDQKNISGSVRRETFPFSRHWDAEAPSQPPWRSR
jgi:hypothetical protein